MVSIMFVVCSLAAFDLVVEFACNEAFIYVNIVPNVMLDLLVRSLTNYPVTKRKLKL